MAKKKNQPRTTRPAASPSTVSSTAGGSGPMDPGLLEQLVQLMSANDITSLDLRDGSQRVSLKRGPQHVAYAPMAAAAPAPVAPAAAAPAAASSAAKPQTPVDDESNLKPIKSPMVGTFYASPSPDAKPFVQVGSVVNEETDICIIEAMKVFNNIKAETRGTIAKICVESGKTVEFGTVLFLVKP